MMYETAEQERRRLALARWDAQYERRRARAQKRRERKTQRLALRIVKEEVQEMAWAKQAVAVRRNCVNQFLLEGISYQEGRRLVAIGWRWAHGNSDGPGGWFTDDERVARNAANRLGQRISS